MGTAPGSNATASTAPLHASSYGRSRPASPTTPNSCRPSNPVNVSGAGLHVQPCDAHPAPP
eukprot:12907952-Prorocentrum_lima.AAC.1